MKSLRALIARITGLLSSAFDTSYELEVGGIGGCVGADGANGSTSASRDWLENEDGAGMLGRSNASKFFVSTSTNCLPVM